MSIYKIAIDLHESGHGFQIVFDGPGVHKAYPKPITDIKDAMDKTFILQGTLERELGIKIPEQDILVSGRAMEYNATSTPSNMRAYGAMMGSQPQDEW